MKKDYKITTDSHGSYIFNSGNYTYIGGSFYMIREEVPGLNAITPDAHINAVALFNKEYAAICGRGSAFFGTMTSIKALKALKIKGAKRTLWTPDGSHFYDLKLIIEAMTAMQPGRAWVSWCIKKADTMRAPIIISVHDQSNGLSISDALIMPVVNTTAQNVAAGAVIAA